MASSPGARYTPSNREMYDLLRRLEQMYELAVWNDHGTMFMPLYGYDGQIVAYEYASDAIEAWHKDLDAVRRRTEYE